MTLCIALVAGAVPIQAAAQATPRPAEPVGRLFFTPAQRASLDVARSQRARTTLATEETAETVVTAAPVPQTITYDGVVRRSDGKTTVWINSRPVVDKGPSPAVVGKVSPDGTVTLQVPQSGRSVELKPGQSIELLSGAVEERFARKPAPEPEPKPAAKPAAEAKGAKPASPEPGRAEQDLEEQQRRLEEAVRALQNAAASKPGTASVPPRQETPR
ncbi:MAG: hypothetical protein HYY78_06555 [Betaproteobacteria bacterium]|nr:hypothetical protein [Betaproteobacteria bacterium]